ncbi:MAG TPA: polysaccharide biosynthesis tyrosine autokinase [Bryobacteraceae bacterium]|nr:polysaccharide biosynthesis tyrosine autokinase [Bryobacteraceae bacterium]
MKVKISNNALANIGITPEMALSTLQNMPFAAPSEPEDEPALPLSHLFWILKRQRWKILGFVTVCVLLTAIVSVRLVPVYEATSVIDVDRLTPQGIIGAEANRSSVNDSDQFLATQMKLIESDAVLRPVAKQFKLQDDAIHSADLNATEAALFRDAPVVLKKLRVARPANTYLITVSFRSPDRNLAANVSNAIVQSYIAHTFDLRYRASTSQSSFMEKQIEELRAKMERSSAALSQFERELNFINPEEKTSILSARLLQLNTEYTTSQGERMKREAELRSMENGDMDSALASAQAEPLRKLIERRNEAQEKFAQVKTQYGANHPEHRKAAGHMAEVQQQIEQTRASIVARVRTEFQQASNREQMLNTAVTQTKSEFDRVNARSFEYQQLRREAEGDKKLYEELTRRIKEAGINASFQNSSVRLADIARPPARPVFPNIPLNVALAFLFSTVIAIGAAIVTDVLDNTVRDPDELSRTLNVQVLGSLPLVSNWRKRLSSALGSETATALMPAHSEDYAITGFKESVRSLRNTILLSDMDRRVRSMLVTSASPSEGKSTTSVHLAISHAEQGKRTLLIDGDLRRPSVHRRFGFTANVGLSNVLLDEKPWDQVLVHQDMIPNLDILPAGPSSRRASEKIGDGLADLVEQMMPHYDLIIVDAPPLLGFSEVLQMATHMDGVLVVARSGATNRKAVGNVVQTLKRLDVNILGLVINEVEHDSSDSYYYYQSNAKYYKAAAQA